MRPDKKMIDAAVSYNRAQPYTAASWREIQRLLLAKQDGKPGPHTAGAIAAVQASHNLTVNGCLTPAVKALLGLQDAAKPRQRRRGAWLDMAPVEVLGKRTDIFIRRLQAMRINAVQVMLTSSKSTQSPVFKWTPEQWQEIASALADANIACGFTVWPRPRAEFLFELIEGCEPFAALHKPDRVEFDAEGNWTRHVEGFGDLEDAAQTLVSLARETFPGVTLACSTIPEHFECGPKAVLSRRCDVVTPQAYSVYKPDKEKYRWGEKYGPGVMQRWTAARAAEIPGSCKIEMALAAWAQKFPHKTIAQAMAESMNEANRYNVDHWLWSLKHVARNWRYNNPCREFLKVS